MHGRNENKYIINDDEYIRLKTRISSVLKKDVHSDEHGNYFISSLYFDNWSHDCANDTDDGINKRFKFRIRFYGGDTNHISLEKKSKLNGICYKEAATIDIDTYNKIVSGDVRELLYSDSSLLKEFALRIMKEKFRPACIVNYDREAYVDELTNTRITFDTNITASKSFDGFLTGDVHALPNNRYDQKILEIKFDTSLPDYIKRLCDTDTMTQTSFSKYHSGLMLINGGK